MTREHRYWLRFESGERSGEKIPLPTGTLTVGRRPESGFRLGDASISSRHAEFEVGAQGVVLRDLGSTNGTLVGNERVEERVLAHGDLVRLGSVRAVFLDGELDDEPEADEGALDEVVGRVSAERVAKSRRGSRVVLVALGLALIVAGGALALRFLRPEAGPQGPRLVEVVPVPGNLLARAYSFEPEGDASGDEGWSSSDDAPLALALEPAWRVSGAQGLGAELQLGEWALSASERIEARVGRSLRARAVVSARDGARVRLGLAFGGAAGGEQAPLRLVAWSLARADVEADELVLEVQVPPGAATAQVLLLAEAPSAPGAAGFDDVSAVAGAARPSAARVGEHELFLAGDQSASATLVRIDRALLAELVVRGPTKAGAPQAGEATLAVRARERGMTLEVSGAPPQALLCLLVPEAAARAGLATTGARGYRAHADEFAEDAASALLVGADLSLVRLFFEAPVRIVGRPAQGGVRVEIELRALRALDVQCSFTQEKSEAARLVEVASGAEARGRRGEALAAWSELLARYPFESDLVARAEERRAALVQAGLSEVREVEQRFERARFFALEELHRQCRERALYVAREFPGGEVEASARALIGRVDAELARLAGAGDGGAARLALVLAALEREGAVELAEHVRVALPARDGDGAPRAPGSDEPEQEERN